MKYLAVSFYLTDSEYEMLANYAKQKSQLASQGGMAEAVRFLVKKALRDTATGSAVDN